MNTRNKLLTKIAAYSTATTAFIGFAPSANAELVGYDMDPDSTRGNSIDTAGFFQININDRGAECDIYVDFSFTIGINQKYDRWIYMYGLSYNQVLGQSSVVKISSTSVTKTFVSTTPSGKTTTWKSSYIGTTTITWWFAAAGSEGSNISSSIGDAKWADWPTMVFGYGEFTSQSFGQWGGVAEKYVGLKFYAYDMDTTSSPGDTLWDSTMHFGWIYLDVAIDARAYTVKGWAYNDTPGEPALFNIDSVNYDADVCEYPSVGITKRNTKREVAIYSYEKEIRVNITDGRRTKGNISIYNLSGQKIQEQSIQGKHNTIKLNDRSSGVFLVKVDLDGAGTRSKKVYIK